MRFRPELRQPALYVVGLSILFVMLVAACGGGDEAPAPTATSAPQATAAPATQPQITPAPTTPDAPPQSGASSGSDKLFIPANETGEIPVTLAAGDVLEINFDVQSNITGGQNVSAGIGQAAEGIQLVVADPVGDQVLTIDQTLVSDTVSVEAKVNGEHLILFFNPFLLQAVSVEVSWAVNP